MNTSQKWTIGAVVVVVAVLVALSVRNKPAPQPTGQPTETETTEGGVKLEGPVRIGLMLPLTGDGAAYGVPIQKAALMAQEEINAAGGIGGQPVEFISEDSKCEPSGGAAAAQKLVNIDKVKIIFGGACSGETLPAAPIAEEAQVLMISPSATNPDISQAGDYIFRTTSSDALQGTVAAEYAYNTLNARKAAVISEQTDYAQGLRKVFTTRFKELGGEVGADEVFQSKDTDLRAQVLKMKEAGPDLVYIVPQTPATTELAVRQLKAQEVNVQFMSTEVFASRDMLLKNPSLFAGTVATEPYYDETAPEAAAFLKKYEEKYNEKPTLPTFMANMYSQMYLMKEGIEKVGMDTTKLKDWLYTVKGWQHALGELTFTPEGDRIGVYAVKEAQPDGSLKQLKVMGPQ